MDNDSEGDRLMRAVKAQQAFEKQQQRNNTPVREADKIDTATLRFVFETPEARASFLRNNNTCEVLTQGVTGLGLYFVVVQLPRSYATGTQYVSQL